MSEKFARIDPAIAHCSHELRDPTVELEMRLQVVVDRAIERHGAPLDGRALAIAETLHDWLRILEERPFDLSESCHFDSLLHELAQTYRGEDPAARGAA